MNLRWSQALDGYLLAAHARGLSKRTLKDYRHTFRRFGEFLEDDRLISEISSADVTKFLAAQEGLSRKTLLNYHTGLSALWRWLADEGYAAENVVRQVKAPKPEARAIQPYSKADVEKLLAALSRSAVFQRGEHDVDYALNEELSWRNRAIILLLLDTGIRSSELCELTIGDTDLRNRRIKVFGKGAKERILPVSRSTSKAIWRYLADRTDDKAPGRPLFIKATGVAFQHRDLYKLIRRIATRAGLREAGIHRFRHTYAINYLRNGGNPFALQMSLGHTTMDMTKRYLSIVQADLEVGHAVASPVENWRL